MELSKRNGLLVMSAGAMLANVVSPAIAAGSTSCVSADAQCMKGAFFAYHNCLETLRDCGQSIATCTL